MLNISATPTSGRFELPDSLRFSSGRNGKEQVIFKIRVSQTCWSVNHSLCVCAHVCVCACVCIQNLDVYHLYIYKTMSKIYIGCKVSIKCFLSLLFSMLGLPSVWSGSLIESFCKLTLYLSLQPISGVCTENDKGVS